MYKTTVMILFMLLCGYTVFAQEQARLVISDTGNTTISRNIYRQFSEHLGRGIYDGFYRNGKIRMDIVNAPERM